MNRPEMLNAPKRRSALLVVCSVLLIAAAVLILLDAVRSMFMFTVEVKGDSMRETLYGGERVGAGGEYEGGDLIYALYGEGSSGAVRFRAERGDIVILDTTDNPGYAGNGGSVFSGQTIVKRLIAVEGDSVKCEGGVVYLREADGEYRALDEPYACNMGSDYRFDEITLGEGEIFFLGDNRAVSQDAQELAAAGCPMFREEDILGVVPSWAVAVKQISTGWESVRGFFSSLFNPNI